MNPCHRLKAACLLLVSLAMARPAFAATCHAESGPQRLPVLELYTSEGCDSCPPADRWLSTLSAQGHAPRRLLALAFHVDYWDYLGWKDPYAQARFSERQRDANRRNKARVVYTPQLLLNGADYRRGIVDSAFDRDIARLSGPPAGAQISITASTSEDSVTLSARIAATNGSDAAAQAFVAVYENNLVSDVAAGENRGKKLRHDFVVRELYGPFALTTATPLRINQFIRRDSRWKSADLHIAVFVQEAATGASLQALSLPWCAASPPRTL